MLSNPNRVPRRGRQSCVVHQSDRSDAVPMCAGHSCARNVGACQSTWYLLLLWCRLLWYCCTVVVLLYCCCTVVVCTCGSRLGLPHSPHSSHSPHSPHSPHIILCSPSVFSFCCCPGTPLPPRQFPGPRHVRQHHAHLGRRAGRFQLRSGQLPGQGFLGFVGFVGQEGWYCEEHCEEHCEEYREAVEQRSETSLLHVVATFWIGPIVQRCPLVAPHGTHAMFYECSRVSGFRALCCPSL